VGPGADAVLLESGGEPNRRDIAPLDADFQRYTTESV